MTCDDVQARLSAAADGVGSTPVDPAVERHAVACPTCTAYATTLGRVRDHLLDTPPPAHDVATAVMGRLRDDMAGAAGGAPRRRRMLPAAAVFVAAAAAAALFVGVDPDEPADVAAADLPDQVAAAQHEVETVRADVTVVERGWHPDVPERSLAGTLTYDAPETLALHLEDRTTYPDPRWAHNDLDVVVDERTWWARGIRDCPVSAQPECTPPAPELRVVTNREPFAESTAPPLDLVLPVQSLARSGPLEELPAQEIDGRPTVGIEATAAQVEPILSAYRSAGNLRETHPADTVALRLDGATLVPLRITVRVAEGPDRREWAEGHGYRDRAGAAILDIALGGLVVNDGPDPDPPPVPSGGVRLDAGFTDGVTGASAAPSPRGLPPGLEPYREGQLDTAEGPPVSIRTWTDGRAWLSVASTSGWGGQRLFGDLGAVVRTVDLGPAGVGYLSEDGRRIAVHADDVDVVVAGSVTHDELRAAAASLGVDGRHVPADWAEAATADVGTARAAIEPLLLPDRVPGFAPPALRVDGATVTASFAGAGSRTFALVQTPAVKLTPPLDTADVVAVTVRGVPGRFSPERGELEWFTDDVLYRLHSETLSRQELLAIAARLAPA